jgi:hypothetical protein
LDFDLDIDLPQLFSFCKLENSKRSEYPNQNPIIMASMKKITLKSSDGEAFVIDKAVTLASQTIKYIIEDGCAESGIKSRFDLMREPHWDGSTHWVKRNHTSELNTASSPKILRHWVYGSSHLYVVQSGLWVFSLIC